MLRDLLRHATGAHRVASSRTVSELPTYQIAFWPDGWDLSPDGSVRLLDTHLTAEARRWYALADRNGFRGDGRRAMSVFGVFVPRAIVDFADHWFPSERVASVAVQLVAGEWIAERRRGLLAAPDRALSECARAWRGSRHEPRMDGAGVETLIADLLRNCIGEGLVPDADYQLRVRSEQGYGIPLYRCTLDARLDSYALDSAREVLAAALLPWNRAVARGGVTALLIELEAGSVRRTRAA